MNYKVATLWFMLTMGFMLQSYDKDVISKP